MLYFGSIVAVLAILSTEVPFPREEYVGKLIRNIKVFDQDGNESFILELIEGKPTIISPIYTNCPSFCSMITAKLIQLLGEGLGKGLGKDFKIITFSFDHRDSKDDLKKFQMRWNIDGRSWVVVGTNLQEDIASFLESFDYKIEEDKETGEIYHPNVVIVVDGSGRVVRFLHIFRISERDLALAISEAKGLSPYLLIYRYNRFYGRYEVSSYFIGGVFLFLFFALLTVGILLPKLFRIRK